MGCFGRSVCCFAIGAVFLLAPVPLDAWNWWWSKPPVPVTVQQKLVQAVKTGYTQHGWHIAVGVMGVVGLAALARVIKNRFSRQTTPETRQPLQQPPNHGQTGDVIPGEEPSALVRGAFTTLTGIRDYAWLLVSAGWGLSHFYRLLLPTTNQLAHLDPVAFSTQDRTLMDDELRRLGHQNPAGIQGYFVNRPVHVPVTTDALTVPTAGSLLAMLGTQASRGVVDRLHFMLRHQQYWYFLNPSGRVPWYIRPAILWGANRLSLYPLEALKKWYEYKPAYRWKDFCILAGEAIYSLGVSVTTSVALSILASRWNIQSADAFALRSARNQEDRDSFTTFLTVLGQGEIESMGTALELRYPEMPTTIRTCVAGLLNSVLNPWIPTPQQRLMTM